VAGNEGPESRGFDECGSRTEYILSRRGEVRDGMKGVDMHSLLKRVSTKDGCKGGV
jgi:hypothetical protein